MRDENEVDVAMILGASLKSASVLSPQSIQNLEKLKELSLKVPVILSGGYSKGNKNDTEASLMMNEVSKISENFGSIYLETESRDSSENVRFSLDIIQKHGWKNIVVIDQPLHLLQLKLLFKHYIRLSKMCVKVSFIPANPVYRNNIKWWQYSHPLVYFIYLMLCTCYYILKRKITLQDIISCIIKRRGL